jgi:hypothetical protein
MGDDPAYPLGGATPYSLLAAKAMGWTMQAQVVDEAASACTQCHRLGAGRTLHGEAAKDGWIGRATGLDSGFASGYLTGTFAATSHARVLPPGIYAAPVDDAAWRASAPGKAVTFLQTCSDAISCPILPVPSTAK